MSWFFGSSSSSSGPARPNGTVLAPAPSSTIGTAVPRGTLLGTATGPTPPDATLAASTAAIAAQAAADKQRKKATAGSISTVLTGTPGAKTPAASLAPRTLMGGRY